ncbi:hypothetical protein BpHYR1_028213 [Brachionus plicatilis]|uniref:Uncharacterized protein n=1 Tax=Brachionus plicatilis TaxID=10195 RepID=A0A3M7R0G9_BRAPC|nr:hypothetical protein BpHYR1_028213 [Brachionus plicatilis]
MSIVETIPEKMEAETNQDVEEHHDANVEQAQPLTGEDKSNSKTSRFNKAFFQERTKRVRGFIAERRFQMKTDQTQLFIILFMSCMAVLCSAIGLGTNNWMCDLNTNETYGLWTTCYNSPVSLSSQSNSTDNQTRIEPVNKNDVKCALQAFNSVYVMPGEKSRIDQLSASQGLIICGTIMYALAVVGMSMAYKYMCDQNLNFVRNCLVTAMVVQIVSFVIQLIGFYLYIMNDTYSTSIVLLFAYFAMAIFSTNIINFITIEYKSFKIRQVSNLI